MQKHWTKGGKGKANFQDAVTKTNPILKTGTIKTM